MITPEQHAEIRRLYFGEHWRVGTIAAALGVHHDTVRAAIAHDTQTVRRGTCRASALDPYLPVIRDTLAQYPRLRATRLFEMARPRVRGVGRPVATDRADDPARGGAHDLPPLDDADGRRGSGRLGRLGGIRIGRGVRPLSGSVMVLSYSRASLRSSPSTRRSRVS
jgi:hypothetical protein